MPVAGFCFMVEGGVDNLGRLNYDP